LDGDCRPYQHLALLPTSLCGGALPPFQGVIRRRSNTIDEASLVARAGHNRNHPIDSPVNSDIARTELVGLPRVARSGVVVVAVSVSVPAGDVLRDEVVTGTIDQADAASVIE